MKRLLLIHTGPRSQGTFFASALTPFYDVVLTGDGYGVHYEDSFADIPIVPLKDVNIMSFDIVFAADQHGIPILKAIQKVRKDIITGVQILDYPIHVFQRNKDYNSRACNIFPEYIKVLNDFNFVVHNQKIAMDLLQDYQKKCLVNLVRYPVRPIKYENIEREDFIIFSGRIAPDKGVSYIIEALSLLENKPKLITIGSGYDFSSFAKFLNVDYLNIPDCSDKEKWLLYAKSRFLVCAADTPYLSSLCPLEGISIGRTSVVFNYQENQFHYRNFVFYCLPINIKSLSGCINYAYTHPEQCDETVKGGVEFHEKETTFNVWGQKIHEIIQENF